MPVIGNVLIILGFVVGAIVVLLLGTALLVKAFYRKVNQGEALIVNKLKAEPVVTFTGAMVLPIIHRSEVMDISLKTIEVTRRGHEGLICADNIRADIQVTFFVRVNKTTEDVLKVAQAVGCTRASEVETVRDLFGAKFSEALKTVGKRLEFVDLYDKRDEFRDDIIRVIGQDLNGYVLEDAAIDYLEQTPLQALDAQNILDAEGIRKITELTTAQNINTNQLQQKERMEIGSQNLTADEAIYRYDQQRAEAEAKKDREIAVAQTREQNEAERYRVDEMKTTAMSKQAAQEEVEKREEDRMRNVEVARKQRERVIAVEEVEVARARDLKQIERERETELLTIDKQKQVEREKKEIADVVRARVAVDKTVAEEEERIKDLRLVAEATRTKEARVVTAEGEAQASMVAEIKKAEAEHEAAKFRAKEKLIEAEASLEASDKEAQAKIRLAEGIKAQEAAAGLAEVTVKEAGAAALEKEGMALARVTREKMLAEAEGAEKQGLAEVKVKDAQADVIEKTGKAEAEAVRLKLGAEAAGLQEKAVAMRELDERSRQHEEFRIELEMRKEVELRQIEIRKDVALAQAEVLGKAMTNAKFQIVGGDGRFFDRFVNALSMGNAVDTIANETEVGKKLLGEYMDGSASLREDLLQLLEKADISTKDLQNISAAALLSKLRQHADGETKERLEGLIDLAASNATDD